jgi:Coenzyme PQQ synthesis protein D (PqqD)
MDGELVVINLRNGLYYASSGVGVHIWQRLEQGASVSQIVHDVVGHYDVPAERAATDVTAFIDKLTNESLVEASDAMPAAAPESLSSANRQRYESPSLTTFDDMAETFALDPPLSL